MAGQLGKGGRAASIKGFAGIDPDTPLYLAIYFNYNAGGTDITTVLDDEATLSDLSGYEAQTPNTNGYVRIQIDDKLGAPTDSGLGYHESTNAADIPCFQTTGALAQTVGSGSPVRKLSYFVITTQQTANTSNTDHIFAFGPLTTEVSTFNTGDTFKILAGNADFRQS